MKVIITEKPSVARDIAEVLNVSLKKNGYIEGEQYSITWAFGHLVTLQEPGQYNPALKRWSLETLPFIPDEFRLTLIKNRGVENQFQTIKTLFEKADEIICATDAGREGELIFRYILNLCACKDKVFRRLWLNSLTTDAIKEAFGNLRDGHSYDTLYAAARCRSESDWIVGLNATRYYTVRYGRIGGVADRVLWSIGRVQTPVLAMIVSRDDSIIQFRPQPFWELSTRYRNVTFTYEERFELQDAAQEMLEKTLDHPLLIKNITSKTKKEQAPQLFDLTTLQREMNKQQGLSAAATLAAAQNLYEAKLITYPRTDSRYLSKDMKSRIPGIFTNLKKIRPEQIGALDLGHLAFSKRIIDDAKVTDHHALLPTGMLPRTLASHEQLVYDAITTQFIAAFYPECVKKITTIDALSNQVKFRAKGTQVVKPGWSALFPDKGSTTANADDQNLPNFEKNETGAHEPFLREGKTKPPNHFTENSLLGAMEAAGKFVEDDTLREALKERGIGTPATRAAIIETLLQRNYIKRDKKALLCTDMGRCLISLIQDSLLKSPEMTGEWEEKLKKIERDQLQADTFMADISLYINSLIKKPEQGAIDFSRWGSCPLCGKEIIKGKRAYGCSDWQNGCPYVLEPEYKDITLSPRQIQMLLQQRIIPRPVRIEDEQRLLILSTQGFPMDLQLPSADRQKQEQTENKEKTEKATSKDS